MQDMMNGVDRQALRDTIAAVAAQPELAAFTFRLANRWVDGGENRSHIYGFHGTCTEHRRPVPFELVNDEPPVLLSGDKGPNPVEHVLHALAGCLTTSLVYHAAARGMKVDAVRTRFEGDLDLRGFLGLSKEVRNGYREIRTIFEIEGDLSEAEKAELMAMGQRYSPVFDIVSRGVPVRCMLAGSETSAAAA
jgi:uncharacterized OsmC-like protein